MKGRQGIVKDALNWTRKFIAERSSLSGHLACRQKEI
jgi:hypothetical protein